MAWSYLFTFVSSVVLLTSCIYQKPHHYWIPAKRSNHTELKLSAFVEVTDSHLNFLSQTESHKTEHNAMVPPIDTAHPWNKPDAHHNHWNPGQMKSLFHLAAFELLSKKCLLLLLL
jgi:hypothetical protein